MVPPQVPAYHPRDLRTNRRVLKVAGCVETFPKQKWHFRPRELIGEDPYLKEADPVLFVFSDLGVAAPRPGDIVSEYPELHKLSRCQPVDRDSDCISTANSPFYPRTRGIYDAAALETEIDFLCFA